MICSIAGCGKKHEARGWCNMHYLRWRHHGTPDGSGVELYRTPEESFAARTEWAGGCLMWTGSLGNGGYGRIRAGGRNVYAHRYAWEKERGVIPPGMEVDHTCHERVCVNVDHLRLSTRQENTQNRSGPTSTRRTNLPRGVYPLGAGFEGVVTHNRVRHSKHFPTAQEASSWADETRRRLFGDFAGSA